MLKNKSFFLKKKCHFKYLKISILTKLINIFKIFFLKKFVFLKIVYYISKTIGKDRKIIYQKLDESLNIDCEKFKHKKTVKLTETRSQIRKCIVTIRKPVTAMRQAFEFYRR